MQKYLDGKKGPVEFVRPDTDQVEFINNGAGLGVGISKKDLILSWNDGISCSSAGKKVSCSVTGSTKPEIPGIEKSAVERARLKPGARKSLKRAEQTLYDFDTTHLDLWNEAKTNIRDINGLIFVSAAVSFGAAATPFAFLPALGLATLAAPLAVGAPVLANGEAIIRNHNSMWFFSNKIDENKWISEIKIDPADVDSVTIKQNDEFYFHAGIKLKKQLHCTITEESDILSIYPTRRLTCT